MTLARLFVILSLDSGPFRSGLVSAMSQLGVLQSQMGGLSGASLASLGRSLMFGLTLPIIAAATAIGVFGSQLDSELARVQSVIATPEDSGLATIQQWRDEIQDLAITLGRTSPEVAGGMYEIVSALGNIPNAMEYLTVAGRAAVAGQSDIVTSTKNLVLATRAWGDSSTEAVRNMANLMSATVRVGTVTESELGPAMANLLPIGRLYNVQLEQLFAGIASLAGVSGSASQASTQLQRAIISITSPNTALTKAYKQLGITSGETLLQQKGLIGAFQEIARISEVTGVPLNKLLGRIEGVKAIATLTGPQLANFGTNLEAIKDSTWAVDQAFEGTTNGINAAAFQWTQAGIRMRVIAEDLYEAFAPASLNVLEALQPIIGNLRSLADVLGRMDTGRLTAILYTLLGLAALGPVLSILGSLVSVFNGLRLAVALLGGSLTTLSGPVGLVILAIGLLWFAWNNNWGNIQGRTASAVAAIQSHLGPLQSALSNAGSALGGIWDAIRNANVSSLLSGLKQLETALVNLGGQTVIAAIDAVGRFFNIDTSGIQNAIQALLDLYNAMAKAASLWESLGVLWGGATKGASAAASAIGNAFPQQRQAVSMPIASQAEWDAEFKKRMQGHTPDNRSLGEIMSGWWSGVQAEFTKGYTTAITQAVQATPIAPIIGPPTFQQVQAGLRSQNFGPAISPVITTGFTSGVTGANWAQVSTSLSTQLKSTAKAPVDSMVAAMQTQLGQALASDKIAGVVKPALETAINQAVTSTNFDQVGQRFVTSMQQTMQQVKSTITSANLSGALRTQLQLMNSALQSTGASMAAIARSIVTRIRTAFTAGGWSSVGASIASGIAAGIRAGSGAIAAAAKAAASSAYSAAMSALQANSPSRLMMKPGLYAAQGLAVGILSGITYIESAANRMIAPLAGLQTGGAGGYALAGAGAGGGITINIENHFNGPVDDATIQKVETANKDSITKALRSRGLI